MAEQQTIGTADVAIVKRGDKPLSGTVERVSSEEATILTRMGEDALKWAPIIADIPTASDDGELNIVMQILAADGLDGIDAAWNADGMEDYVDKPITVTGIRKAPSDYAGGWGFFMLVDAVEQDGVTRKTLTTGSVAIVTQLIKLHSLGAFPITVVPRRAAQPSKSGFYPMHLERAR